MEQEQGFIDYIEQSIIKNWDRNALTDYKGITLQYKDVARKIAKFHIVLESAGIRPGDKIAVCGRNSAHWAVAFLATVTYGAVIVPILHEFKADNIHNIVNHSEAKLLFVGDRAWENLNEEAMPLLMGIVLLTDFTPVVCRNEQLMEAFEHRNVLYGTRFPKNFRPEHISYRKEESPEELSQFARRHDQIDAKLKELKNIIIKYYPAGGNDYLLNAVLFDIFSCEQDLASHCRVEDYLFVPAVLRLEKEVK